MRSRLLLSLLLLLALLALLLWWWWRPVVTPLEVVSPSLGPLRVTVVNTRAGTIKSCQRAGLSLPQGGIVQRIDVAAGDRVRAGQPLLTLRNDDLQAEVQRAEATARLNQTLRAQRCVEASYQQREADRLASLQARNLTSKTLSERAATDAASSRYACEAAAVMASSTWLCAAAARARLAHSQLVAPFSGVVAEVNSKLGEYMTPSPPGVAMPPVIDLIDDRCLYVSAPIDEVDAARLRLGQSVTLLLDALPAERFTGRLRRIAPYVRDAENQARTVEIEAEFTHLPSQQTLLIGYSADVEIEIAHAEQVLRLPAEVRRDDGSVLVLQADGRLQVRHPRWGLENWNWLQVTAGLVAGDQVVRQPGTLDPAHSARYQAADAAAEPVDD